MKKNIIPTVFVLLTVVVPQSVLADDTGGGGNAISIGGSTIPIPAGYQIGGLTTVESLIQVLIQLGLMVGVLLAFIFLILGGIRWIIGGGDKEATAKAKDTVTSALIGLVLLFLSFAIIVFIQETLDISIGLPRKSQ